MFCYFDSQTSTTDLNVLGMYRTKLKCPELDEPRSEYHYVSNFGIVNTADSSMYIYYYYLVVGDILELPI